MLAITYEVDRHRGEERRHAHHRGLLEARVEHSSRVERSSVPARLAAAILRTVRRERHSLTNYPCRLPDGKIGRTAVILVGGEWALECRVA
jgi:hypothetical protein